MAYGLGRERPGLRLLEHPGKSDLVVVQVVGLTEYGDPRGRLRRRWIEGIQPAFLRAPGADAIAAQSVQLLELTADHEMPFAIGKPMTERERGVLVLRVAVPGLLVVDVDLAAFQLGVQKMSSARRRWRRIRRPPMRRPSRRRRGRS